MQLERSILHTHEPQPGATWHSPTHFSKKIAPLPFPRPPLLPSFLPLPPFPPPFSPCLPPSLPSSSLPPFLSLPLSPFQSECHCHVFVARVCGEASLGLFSAATLNHVVLSLCELDHSVHSTARQYAVTVASQTTVRASWQHKAWLSANQSEPLWKMVRFRTPSLWMPFKRHQGQLRKKQAGRVGIRDRQCGTGRAQPNTDCDAVPMATRVFAVGKVHNT